MIAATISSINHDYFSDSSNELHVSNFIPPSDQSDSDSSISYSDTDESQQPTEFEDMLLDGLLGDDYTDEYLAKLKDLEIRLQEKVSSGHFRCKVKHAKVYK